ncbi:phosphatase PAP2 family protein [Hyunsoonleella sp. SJ7]|uniref:Phosphatase PAP2 family protein n=1 Tax=Hyunsoonleella aquatilis TaxID=2762758 RepID=A0A923H9E8_9FLAO|nr:phosphatase PAP2 family protein [Hyunsoonleella aquatilis]MBC3759721.1 phosphatase PAP2 family protein [Hyunsoonleella aquatilis]
MGSFRFFSAILAFVFSTMALNAQSSKLKDSLGETQPKKTTFSLLKHDTKQTARSVAHAFTRPVYWKGNDFGKLGILLAGTASLSLADEEGRRFFKRQQEDFPGVVRDFGWYFGSPQNYFMANAGLYGFGLFTKNEQIRKTSVLIISSSVTSGFLQSFLKTAVGRERPGEAEDPFGFKLFSSQGRFHSFPSGHTVLSMTMAHALAKQFENIWVKVGIYSVIGAIPPISRLIDGAHWLTDVGFSVALSIIVVDSIDRFLFSSEAYEYKKPPKKIAWNLRFGPNTIGVIGTF